MSPFSVYLSELRIRHGLRQTKLAALLGYEQGYISALELGTKGPSNEEFLARLVQVFRLTDQEQAELALAVKQSQVRYTLPRDIPPEAFRFFAEVYEKIERLAQPQWQAMRAIASLDVPAREERAVLTNIKETEAPM
ncbi:helix-turn-helix domain-containing protein [Pseudoduganella danionis]|uniref:helix-turn-helix domain-containing protein n=1 Tax=Pseudoduganella danionis TaxID=1890295 RepID=UPI0035B078A9